MDQGIIRSVKVKYCPLAVRKQIPVFRNKSTVTTHHFLSTMNSFGKVALLLQGWKTSKRIRLKPWSSIWFFFKVKIWWDHRRQHGALSIHWSNFDVSMDENWAIAKLFLKLLPVKRKVLSTTKTEKMKVNQL